ncbi:phage tail assembly protein [Escherichia coli]|nr:phage tail assembly protein [Escherichia coli]EFB1451357.1 phage tail assembly protein [Escherichia coli]EFE1413307.1 phage tail assembly protein [Escherichia coli]EFL9850470.1 phage tail assembly protein [Escherichia coli]HBA7836257.1 phage tail assembly protein [Escherichia coli]
MSEKNSVPASCVEIVLSVPYVTASGQTITHVTMRAPTVRDRLLHRRSTKPEAEADLDMIAGLCGMDAADMMNMEACDYLALERQFNVFLLPPVRRKKNVS